MVTIITELLKKEPTFPKRYEYLFERYSRKWGGSEQERLDKAKVFAKNYEFYIYAFFLGLRKHKRIKFEQRGKERSDSNVMNVESWRPIELRDYLVACVLAEDGTPLRNYDLMTEEELSAKSSELREIIEEYVYGGLSIIEARFKEDKAYFDELFAFSEFVFE